MWALLLANWKTVGIGIAVVALMGYIAFLRIEVGHYKASLAQAESDVMKWESAYNNSLAQIKNQNAAIDELKAKTQALDAKRIALINALNGKLNTLNTEIDKIDAIKVDPRISDCENTKHLLDTYAAAK